MWRRWRRREQEENDNEEEEEDERGGGRGRGGGPGVSGFHLGVQPLEVRADVLDAGAEWMDVEERGDDAWRRAQSETLA